MRALRPLCRTMGKLFRYFTVAHELRHGTVLSQIAKTTEHCNPTDSNEHSFPCLPSANATHQLPLVKASEELNAGIRSNTPRQER